MKSKDVLEKLSKIARDTEEYMWLKVYDHAALYPWYNTDIRRTTITLREADFAIEITRLETLLDESIKIESKGVPKSV